MIPDLFFDASYRVLPYSFNVFDLGFVTLFVFTCKEPYDFFDLANKSSNAFRFWVHVKTRRILQLDILQF